MSSKLFLKPDDVIDIDGNEFIVSEVKEHIIDSLLYRKHLQKSINNPQKEE